MYQNAQEVQSSDLIDYISTDLRPQKQTNAVSQK